MNEPKFRKENNMTKDDLVAKLIDAQNQPIVTHGDYRFTADEIQGLIHQALLKIEQQQTENEKLKEMITLYIEYRNKGQFLAPEKVKRIGELIGMEIEDGLLVSALRRWFEQALKGQQHEQD